MTPSRRVQSVDALRGAIMIVMAIDHIRDFIHAGAMRFSPTDLTQTTAATFLTRPIVPWVAVMSGGTVSARCFCGSRSDGSACSCSSAAR